MKREKPEECDSCGFVTTELQLFADQDTTIGGGGKTIKADFWFCDLCCSTATSAYDRYPDQTPSNTQMMKTICYVGNVVLAELRRGTGQ